MLNHFFASILSLLFAFNSTVSPTLNTTDFKDGQGGWTTFIQKIIGQGEERQKYQAPKLKKGQHHVATIRFNSDVNQYSASTFIDYMDQINKAGAEAVVIEINSPGGRVDAGFEMSKVIENSQAKTVCVVDGDAVSMGYYILQSCDIRLMTKRSILMIHAPLLFNATVTGDQSRFKQIYEMMHALTEAMLDQFSKKTIVSLEAMRLKIADGKEWWVSWKEATSLLMVDGTVASTKDVVVSLTNKGEIPLTD